jgi:hypothetical protein
MSPTATKKGKKGRKMQGISMTNIPAALSTMVVELRSLCLLQPRYAASRQHHEQLLV